MARRARFVRGLSYDLAPQLWVGASPAPRQLLINGHCGCPPLIKRPFRFASLDKMAIGSVKTAIGKDKTAIG